MSSGWILDFHPSPPWTRCSQGQAGSTGAFCLYCKCCSNENFNSNCCI